MTVRKADLAQEALDKSLEMREEAGLKLGTPLNVFDVCERLTPKVRVRFADYSMEGCYSRSDRPLIEVSALRPSAGACSIRPTNSATTPWSTRAHVSTSNSKRAVPTPPPTRWSTRPTRSPGSC